MKSSGWDFKKVESAKINYSVWFHLSCSHFSEGKMDETWRIMWAEIRTLMFLWIGRKSICTFPRVWVECMPPTPRIGKDECCRGSLSKSTVFLEINDTSEPEAMSILSWWDVTDESYHANAVANSVDCENGFVCWVWPCWDKMIAPLSYWKLNRLLESFEPYLQCLTVHESSCDDYHCRFCIDTTIYNVRDSWSKWLVHDEFPSLLFIKTLEGWTRNNEMRFSTIGAWKDPFSFISRHKSVPCRPE